MSNSERAPCDGHKERERYGGSERDRVMAWGGIMRLSHRQDRAFGDITLSPGAMFSGEL